MAMKVKKPLQTGGFDAVIRESASPTGISEQVVVSFVGLTRRTSQFPWVKIYR